MQTISLSRKTGLFLKAAVSKIVLFVLYRAIKVLAAEDSRIRQEFLSWPEGLTVILETCANGPAICLRKEGDRFRSLDAAFLVLTGQIGVARAYAEHRFMLSGDICQTMSLVRCIDIAESYLFPRLLTKRILRKVETREVSAIHVYRKIFVGV